MRCLYCGKQLPLLRRLTGSGEFCSDAHKHSYHEEYNRLALSRLIAAQSKPTESRNAPPAQSPHSNIAPDPLRARALPVSADSLAKGRRNDTRDKLPSRLLEASVESASPPVAGFQLSRLTPNTGTIPQPGPSQIESIPILVTTVQPEWTMSASEDMQQLPGAESVAYGIRPSPQIPGEAEIALTAAPDADFVPSIVSDLPLNPYGSAGFTCRHIPKIELQQFAPDISARTQIISQFERFNFAVMIFGAPSLPLLASDLTPLSSFAALALTPTPPEPELGQSIEALRAAAAAPFVPKLIRPDESPSAPRPVLPILGDNRNGSAEQGPRSAKRNLAALTANLTPDTSVRPPGVTEPALKPASRTLAEMLTSNVEPVEGPSHERGPKTTTPTANHTGYQTENGSNSVILQSPTAEADTDKGIWSTLRRYIKR